MIELSMNNISKYYGANKIFEHISMEVKSGERIGLIGSNGCGKTTLMKILMGEEDYQEGTISLRKDIKLGYLNQIPVYEENTKVIDVLMLAFEEAYRCKKQMLLLEEAMTKETGEALDNLVRQYSRLLQQYEHSGGYETETKIAKIAEGLQISDVMQEMSFEQLSGGEKTRVILAKILLEEPDILLLDEPTNHLDLMTIQWLEEFLKEYRGASVIISHDRFFLDRVVTKIFELEQDHIEVYQGNYSYYVMEKERRFLLALKNYQNQQKKIQRMEQQIQRYRIWGEMRDSDKMFRRAKELEKRLEKIEPLDKPIKEKRNIRLQQATVDRSGKIVLELMGLTKAYDNRELLKDVGFTLFYQDSACIIGGNGCGKTTLLKMILGEEMSDRGEIKVGAQVKIGYLPQQVVFADEEMTVLEYFAGLHNITYGAARAQLAKVLFVNEDVNKKIKFLSGGEKSRLRLCSLTFEGANFLILDEPTNHLDIESREVLEKTLCEFEGTLLFVSHDRYFIDKVADKILVLENQEITEYKGDYSYYLEEVLKKQAKEAAAGKQTPPSGKGKAGSYAYGQAKQSEKRAEPGKPVEQERRPEQQGQTERGNRAAKRKQEEQRKQEKKAEELEKYIEELEERLKVLERQMLQNSYDSNRLTELYTEKELLEMELANAFDRWESVIS